MNILITTGEWKSSLTCMRSFAKAGHKVSLLSSSPFTPHFYSKFCRERIVGPEEGSKSEFLGFVFGLASRKKYDLIVPMSDVAVNYFSESRDEFQKFVKLILPSPEAVMIASNKDETCRLALRNGVPIPQTFFPQDAAEAEKIADRISYPCLTKEPQGCGGRGNTRIEDKAGLISTFAQLSKQKKWAAIQEYITGQSCSLVCVCREGKILRSFMYESLRKYPENVGPSVYVRSYFSEKLLRYCGILADRLAWTGPVHFEFILARGGEFFLLEINPRFPGSLQIAVCCGIDLPLAFLKLADGARNLQPQKKYKTGVIYRAIFPQEINSCRENKKYIFDFFLNFLRPNTRYDFSLLDPKLLWWQLKQTKWTLWPKRRLA